MDKVYNHLELDPIMNDLWEKSGVFTPPSGEEAAAKGMKPFTIIMPPPNANDPLHVGHAMFVTIEDILIRYHRMKGEAALWLPGTDHAGIETQFVFEKKLAKEGKSRFQFDRDTLYHMIWDYVQKNSDTAVSQMKKLGASADWSRFKFTLNPEVTKFVLETFFALFHDGLIYRGERLVNYCTKCGTGYSELEVEKEERIAKLYYIKYLVKDRPDEFVTVATTRIEPIWADTHLAVHPKDKKNIILTRLTLVNPLTGADMRVIADEMVDPEFGTGVVKLTPAHDQADFEAAERHNLPIIKAIDQRGKMISGPFAGLKVNEAREATYQTLLEKGLVDHVDEKYIHRIGTCYRCHNVIEPLPLPQFFLKTKGLAAKALEALDKKETKVLGAGREKILRHWLENIHDWNISRQIVWGIRIPVWYKVDGHEDEIAISFINPQGVQEIGTLAQHIQKGYSTEDIRKGLQQLSVPISTQIGEQVEMRAQEEMPNDSGIWLPETDTFDTWFSSGQWPVVTLKTGNEGDFNHYYPTSVMETGYDILPIWVMRMMMMGIYLTDRSPFEWVYLHGLIRDEQGRKMSKSIGNVINPLDMADKYGADALRMALVISSTPGQDKNVGENTIRGMRNLANKIWNAARFVLESENLKQAEGANDAEFEAKLTTVCSEVESALDKLKVGQAAEALYDHFWHWYCDKAIEQGKKGEIGADALRKGLATFMKLLHPFTPYVTEAVWQEGKKLQIDFFDSPTLISTSWPH